MLVSFPGIEFLGTEPKFRERKIGLVLFMCSIKPLVRGFHVVVVQ